MPDNFESIQHEVFSYSTLHKSRQFTFEIVWWNPIHCMHSPICKLQCACKKRKGEKKVAQTVLEFSNYFRTFCLRCWLARVRFSSRAWHFSKKTLNFKTTALHFQRVMFDQNKPGTELQGQYSLISLCVRCIRGDFPEIVYFPVCVSI